MASADDPAASLDPAGPQARTALVGSESGRASNGAAAVHPVVAVPVELDGAEAAAGPASGDDWLDVICPYLRSDDGTWRAATPVRDHRCWALDGALELPVLTQQRLCLTQAHSGCERYLRAQEVRVAALARDHIAPERIETARFGPFVSPVPLAVEGGSPVRTASQRPAARRGRGRRVPAVMIGGGGFVALLLLAAFALNGGAGHPPLAPASSPTAPAGAVVPSAAPPLAATLHPTSPEPAAAPTQPPGTSAAPPGSSAPDAPAASAHTAPSATATLPAASPTVMPRSTLQIARRYRIRNGDTMRSIAAHFGVTVHEIKLVNDLGDPPILRPGTYINIPGVAGSPAPG